MPDDLCLFTLKQAIQYVDQGGDPADLHKSLCARIQVLNPKINAVLRFQTAEAAAWAEKQGGYGVPFRGVPVSVKDNICIRGRETACGSKILSGHIPPYDATVVEKLKVAGAVIFSQLNMDEFAFGSSCETSAYGPVLNPWNLERVPGGSSGGSAAAVAADMALAALGSDTGGSIRQPASLCGIVGLKPTYGRVSRYGLVAFGSSFDQIGPLTKTVEDAALLLTVLAGHDTRDSTSMDRPVPDYTQALTRDVKGLRIGLPDEYFVKGMDPEVEKSVREAAAVFEKMGARVERVSLPYTEYSVAVYYVVAVAEASSNLGRFDGVRYGTRASTDHLRDMYFKTRSQGFGAEAKRRILLGTFVLSAGYYDAYYRQGQKVRSLIRNDFTQVFKRVDLILSPTSPTPAFKIGEKAKDPLAMYLSDIYTIPANLAGIPAISVPCGFTKSGLPVGLQLMARPFEEELLLRAAHAFEQEVQVYRRKPNLE